MSLMELPPRILVTGATGQIGREVVAQLRAAGRPVRALSRQAHPANLPGDVEAVRGDLSLPETLDAALAHVGAVFLVWTAPFASAAAAIERIASRAERIVFLSAPLRTNHPFYQQPNERRWEAVGLDDLIEQSATRWTVLRPGPFALNCRNWWAPQIRNSDVVRWFHGAAQTAAVHEHDIAAVAVRALCDNGHDRQDYLLTGPESLTQREQLAIIGETIGRTLVFEEVSSAVVRRELLPPAWLADMLLSAYGAAVDLPALVTSTIEEVTGTPARTFRQWASDHAADFMTS
jgi:uncharacterized protein YbjT (DUF2867 family)